MTAKTSKKSAARITKEELFLLHQLSGDKLTQAQDCLKSIRNRTLRIVYILDDFGDDVQIEPDEEENKAYNELIEMIEDCRRRAWGARSQVNLINYFSTNTQARCAFQSSTHLWKLLELYVRPCYALSLLDHLCPRDGRH